MEKNSQSFPKGLRGLIVDDHDLIRKTIAKVLRKLEFAEVYEAHNGKDARAIIDSQNIDLVICDLDVNFISGFELLDHVRALDTGSDIPFIIVTGAAGKEDIVKAANKGAEDYIVKPFQSEELEAKVIKVLNQYHAPGPVLARLRMAEKKIQLGEFEAASTLLMSALKLKDSPRGRHLEAVLLMKQKRTTEAVQQLLENLRVSPSYLKNYVTLSNLFIESRDVPNAIKALMQELDIHPKQPLRQIKLANMLLKDGNTEASIEHYRLALLENNKNPEALYGMGTAYAMTENMDKAIYYFKRYRRHHPRDSRPLKAIVQFAKKFKKNKIAELALIDEKKSHPDRLDTYTVLAEYYFGLGLVEQAFATLEAAIKRKPDYSPAHVMMANFYLQASDLKSAINVYERYGELTKDPNAHILLSRMYFEIGKPSLAISALHAGMEANADPSKVFPVLFHATYKTKQLAKTYFVRERLRQINPELDIAEAFAAIDTYLRARRKNRPQTKAS